GHGCIVPWGSRRARPTTRARPTEGRWLQPDPRHLALPGQVDPHPHGLAVGPLGAVGEPAGRALAGHPDPAQDGAGAHPALERAELAQRGAVGGVATAVVADADRALPHLQVRLRAALHVAHDPRPGELAQVLDPVRVEPVVGHAVDVDVVHALAGALL